MDDPETEVALNLICVDETTRQTIDVPIRPRPIKDVKNEVHKRHHRPNEVIKIDLELKNKQRLDRSNANMKSGKTKL